MRHLVMIQEDHVVAAAPPVPVVASSTVGETTVVAAAVAARAEGYLGHWGNFEILALGTYAHLSLRGSNVREHGRLVRDQGRRHQRPEAFHPSSGLPDFLEVRPVQKHQDAFVVPFLVRDVQHLGVERPLDGDRGPCHVAACLDERETFAPSSSRRGFSNDQKTVATAVTHKSDKTKATKRERERGQ